MSPSPPGSGFGKDIIVPDGLRATKGWEAAGPGAPADAPVQGNHRPIARPAEIHRRTFLRQTAALVGLGLTGRAFAETPLPAGFGLGFSLYGMKSLPLETALRTCAEIGYDNVEFALLNGYPTEPSLLSSADRSRIRELLAALRLRLSGLMEGLSLVADEATHQRNLERIKAAAQLAYDMAPDAPPPLETVLGGKPAEWEQIKEGMAAQLRAWAEVAAAAKIVIAIKGHIFNAAQTPERVLWLMRQADSPWVQLTYDYSHFALQGLSLDETLAPMLPHARFIHVKDGRKAGGGAFEFLLPGEGSIDYADYFQKLNKLGYHGDVVVEVSAQLFKQPDYDPQAAARKSFVILDAAVTKAGLKRGW
ncbi:MAG: hypothetical protein QOE70_6152 [Chthoniobacter sp.]|jgi:inosose dehydratase|nr:hypothetical protein [Chthoniobacter sp.]